MPETRILFVDDEPAIRLTFPAILRQKGFEVEVCGTVTEALEAIGKHKFEVLISDLNIGQPGDGFTVVSAMRRTQPEAVTFILTGYPDFETALQAIRSQVDDYLIKPADIGTLVNAVQRKLADRGNRQRPLPIRRISQVLRDKSNDIVEQWLKVVLSKPLLAAIPMSREERIDHVPELVLELVVRIESERDEPSTQALGAAEAHGRNRFASGYTIPLLVLEARLFQRVVTTVLQSNLLAIDISSLIPDILQIGDSIAHLLEASIRAFQEAERRSRNVA
jgi:ActR/RegA family two-component response regulator